MDVLKRSKQIKRKKKVGLAVLIGLALIILIGGTIWLAHRPWLLVARVMVEGNQMMKTEELITVASSTLAGNYLWFFPKRNVFLCPKRTVAHDLLKTWLRLKMVTVAWADWQTLKLSLVERKTTALWCRTDDEEECFLADDSGYLFSAAPNFVGEVYLQLQSFLPKEILGRRPLPAAAFRNIVLLSQTLPAIMDRSGLANEKLTTVSLSGDNVEFHLFAGDRPEWRLIFKTDLVPEVAATDLATVLGNEAVRKEITGRTEADGYLDLRYGQKVFYKFR